MVEEIKKEVIRKVKEVIKRNANSFLDAWTKRNDIIVDRIDKDILDACVSVLKNKYRGLSESDLSEKCYIEFNIPSIHQLAKGLRIGQDTRCPRISDGVSELIYLIKLISEDP